MSNLIQVINYDDLLYFLREGRNKIIVLTLVLINTDDNIKHMLKKFIKEKSQEFPYITFIYYIARQKDLGKVPATILEKDENQYPKLCHIFDIDNLLGDITSIDNIKELDKSFAKLKPKYEQWIHDQQKNTNNTENTDSIKEKQSVKEQQIIPEQQENIIDPMKEKKKYMEKLMILKSKGDEYKIEFITDIQKRKQEEEKNKKKIKS